MAGKTKARPYKKGRPTKRTDRLEAKLEEYLVMGLPRWAACALVGISRQCFSEWMHQVPGFKEKVRQTIPLGRIPSAEDIAGPILFLASDLARHVTGELLDVNGGAVLVGG